MKSVVKSGEVLEAVQATVGSLAKA
jgi:hypothetical protein